MTDAGLHGEFPPSPLRQYALIADGERGALCSPHGALVWMCVPHWHDDAVFSTLVGGRGAYAVTPTRRSVWGGEYEPGTLIWRNTWVGDDNSVVECRDALALPAAPDGPVILRRIVATRGPAQVRVFLDVAGRYGTDPMTDLHRDESGVWTARSGQLWLRWQGCGDAEVDDDGRLVATIDVAESASHDLVLEICRREVRRDLPRADRLWESTGRAWAELVPDFPDCAAPRDTRHAYAVMRGLTSSSGGMVAAATMALPEHAGDGTNYDYRYVWLRDQAYAGLAVATDGPHPLLLDAVRFVRDRLLADGPDVHPAYRVDGLPVPDEQHGSLPGYPGGADIRGNRVSAQFQLDALGEALQLFAAAARHDVLDRDGWAAAQRAIDIIEKRWTEPDAGIWELDDDWWAHSRLACVAGLRRVADEAAGGEPDRWRDLADALFAETARRCTHPSGRWQRSATDERVDAALLLPPLRGAAAADDPRTIATLQAVRRDLVDDGYVYRYAPRGALLGEREGAFLLCGFVLALAEWHQGNLVEAFRWFERNRAACGPAGLLAEEFDVGQRQLRGNLPQAFVHALLLETSVRLGRTG